MAKPLYAIGIDLGTTNCVLSYVDMRTKGSVSVTLPIPQKRSLDMTERSKILPSNYYFATPDEAASARLDPFAEAEALPADGVVGLLARERLQTIPGRVVHSAKSWLSHSGIDRESKLLPFASEEIAQDDKLSPIAASAAYLRHLKAAWNHTMAFTPEEEFSRQRVTVTVPASFDEDAQELTRLASMQAGFPSTVRLLEEPQAAFYAWIEAASAGDTRTPSAKFLEVLPALAERTQRVLVCDIGGGTSDFSQFQLFPPESPQDLPRIERLAVSDHLLLGGDNIDLALAHEIEKRLKPDSDDRLSRRQWQYLVPQARMLKERILGGDLASDEMLHISIPGEGSSLFASSLSAGLTPEEVHAVVLDGFFPVCASTDRPATRQSGLREFGLPYAADTGISRHLAAFLTGQAVDAVLFAGGTVQPQFLRNRLISILQSWQDTPLIELQLEDMNLAIARGAAYFGAILESSKRRIRGGHARSVYMELHSSHVGQQPDLVCVLPQGVEEGVVSKLNSPRFELLLHKPARFTAYTSHRRREDKLGDVVKLDDKDFHPLPPMHTTLALDEETFDARRAAAQTVQVKLEVGLTDLGVLQLALIDDDHAKRWRLDFNLRKRGQIAGAGIESGSAQPDTARKAIERIELFYGKRQNVDEKLNVKNLLKDLERIAGQPRDAWDLAFLRALWPAVYQGMTRRGRSLAHENIWLYLAGLVLRPGYGAELDPWRITQLWSCYSLGLTHRKEKSALANWWIMWRRVAGGLSAEQQEVLFKAAMLLLRKSPLEFSEGTRVLGALERIPISRKTDLASTLMEQVMKGKAASQPHIFWTLGRVLSRVPLYTAAEAVVPPGVVENYFGKVEKLDWKAQGLMPLVQVFSAACRVTGDRGLDIHGPVRERVLAKLSAVGAREDQVAVVREYYAMSQEDRTLLFGEEMPVGLKLAGV